MTGRILLYLFIVLLTSLQCKGPDEKKTSAEISHSKENIRITGQWILNREKTIARHYLKQGISWNAMSESRKQSVRKSFGLDFRIQITADNRWNASYTSGKVVSSSQGSYRILSATGNQVTAETVTEGEPGTQILDFYFSGDGSALLIIRSDSQTAEFIIEKT